jgi:hypothetical protein
MMKPRANWRIGDTENTFVQAKTQLASIEEILALEDRQQGRRESGMPLNSQDFFGAPFKFEWSLKSLFNFYRIFDISLPSCWGAHGRAGL